MIKMKTEIYISILWITLKMAKNMLLYWIAWNRLTLVQNLPITWRIINGLCKAKCLKSDGKISQDANSYDYGNIWGQAN